MKLENRTAIVTGSARGIGKAIAARLAADGARVVITDILDTAPAVADIRKSGAQALGVQADVSLESDVAALVARAVERFKGIDILVNNAAMTAPPRPFEEVGAADWRRMMEVNTLGPYLCARAALPHLRACGHGRIINVASDTASLGVPYMLHYVSSKGAMLAFTRALAREVGKDHITVNSLSPGFTLSERIAAQTDRVELFRREVMTSLAIQRDELPEDLVGAASFLASDDSAFMTGQNLVVDGGFAMP